MSTETADNDHRRIAIDIGARFAQPVAPVLGAEIARTVGLGPHFERFLVSLELFQRGDDGPGAQAGVGIGREAHDAGAAAQRGFEFEQGFDRFDAGTADPARRRSLRGNMKVSWRGARERFAQCRSDCGAARHRLDGPGEGQHVAPETVGMEAVGDSIGIARLQCSFEAREPSLRVRRRVRLLSLRDVHHSWRPPSPRLVRPARVKTWMAGTSPAMTRKVHAAPLVPAKAGTQGPCRGPGCSVIPGRAEGANPESRHKPLACIWIPGPALTCRPGMTGVLGTLFPHRHGRERLNPQPSSWPVL